MTARRSEHDNKAIFRIGQGTFLFYWKAYKAWAVGPDYTKFSTYMYVQGGDVACPIDLEASWKYWDSGAKKWATAAQPFKIVEAQPCLTSLTLSGTPYSSTNGVYTVDNSKEP